MTLQSVQVHLIHVGDEVRDLPSPRYRLGMPITEEELRRNRLRGLESLTVTEEDVAGFLTRAGQRTLSELVKYSRRPIESEMITSSAKFFHSFYMRYVITSSLSVSPLQGISPRL